MLSVFVVVGAWLQGCASVGAGFVTPNPTPTPPSAPGAIAVTVAPASAAVSLGNAQTFTATVTNTSDANVVWSVNGVTGGNAAVRTVSTAGIYTAPGVLPAVAAVQITATSQADLTKSGIAKATVTSDLQIALSATSAAVELGATKSFRALITGNGHPQYERAVDIVWGGLLRRVWGGRCQRQFHRAADSAGSGDRGADSAERCRSIEARICRVDHHQRFHAAVVGSNQRGCGKLGENRSDVDRMLRHRWRPVPTPSPSRLRHKPILRSGRKLLCPSNRMAA